MAKIKDKKLYTDEAPTSEQITAHLYANHFEEFKTAVTNVLVEGAYFAQGEQVQEYENIARSLIEYRKKAFEFVEAKKKQARIE